MNLLEEAWRARGKAYVPKSGTKVGCVIETKVGKVARGWNIEGLWMTSIHAEVCAITQLVGLNERGIRVVLVAETEFFTPCGSCLDWLFQFCEDDCEVIIQNKRRETSRFLLRELMPFYPKQ